VKTSVAKLGVDKYLGKSADAIRKQALDQVAPLGGTGGGQTGDALKGLFGK
jgi:hypothetical protein